MPQNFVNLGARFPLEPDFHWRQDIQRYVSSSPQGDGAGRGALLSGGWTTLTRPPRGGSWKPRSARRCGGTPRRSPACAASHRGKCPAGGSPASRYTWRGYQPHGAPARCSARPRTPRRPPRSSSAPATRRSPTRPTRSGRPRGSCTGPGDGPGQAPGRSEAAGARWPGPALHGPGSPVNPTVI
jgi:hypothetical protein